MPTRNHQLHMLGPVPGTGGRCSKELGDQGPAAHSLPGHTQHALIIDALFANNQCAGGFGEVTVSRHMWGRASLSLGSHVWGQGEGTGETPSFVQDGEH